MRNEALLRRARVAKRESKISLIDGLGNEFTDVETRILVPGNGAPLGTFKVTSVDDRS